VSWKLSCTVLRGGAAGNGGSLLDVRREVVCVIVRRRHPAGPAVSSAVPYEVRRFGNVPSKSPRTMYPAVSRRVSNPQGDDISASIRRTGARVDGMVSVSKPPKVSSSMKGPKMLSGPECGRYGCSILTRHGHNRPPAYEEGPTPIPSHIRNTVSPYRSRKGSHAARYDDGNAGRGWRNKRKPSCNGTDTSSDTRRESGLTSSWSSVTREFGKSA
jgi:hypothetical protein